MYVLVTLLNERQPVLQESLLRLTDGVRQISDTPPARLCPRGN